MIVYRITNVVTGAAYIGITIKPLGVRYSNHWTRARGKSGRLSALHRDMRAYGFDAFAVEHIACAWTIEGLQEAECAIIAQERTFWRFGGYNLTLGGEGATTGPQPASTIAKRAASIRGSKRTHEQKSRISAALKGKPKSDAHRAALSVAKIGHKRSAESVEKSAASRRGRKQSEETIHRRSETLKRINKEKRHALML